MSGSANVPRGGRTRTACDLCRHKKIQCDGAKPACETCHLAGVPCTFTAQASKPRKSTREQLVEAKARIRELEALIGAQPTPQWSDAGRLGGILHGSSRPSSPPEYCANVPPQPNIKDTHDFDIALSVFRWYLEYCGPGLPRSSQREFFYSLIHHHTGTYLDLDNFSYRVSQSFKSQGYADTIRKPMPVWPSQNLAQKCLDHFAGNILYSVFPVIDFEVMRNLLATGILETSTDYVPSGPRACLVAFTALITQLHRHEPAFIDAEPDGYLVAALSLLPQLLVEGPNIRTLETLIILMILIFPLGDPNVAGLLLSLAVRIVYSLGGNRRRAMSEHGDKHLRALFWLCYAFDKDFSIRFYQPPVMNDTDCDLELPENYVLTSSDHQFLHKPLSTDVHLFPSDLRLALIKSKIYILLYSDYGLAQSEARRLQYIRELDQELNDLRASFPPNCQPDTFATERAPNYLIHDLSLRGVNLHLEYYFCLGKIHEASSLCDKSSLKKWPLLPSSVELYCHESRYTLLYICRIKQFLTWHTFWIHAQFLLTAITSLFQYLITFPTALNFERDLHLMEQTAEIFAQLYRESQDTKCFPPFYITEAFIRRLILLARQAESKARSQ